MAARVLMSVRGTQHGLEGEKMESLILSATLMGSLASAWIIQRAILTLCLKAIDRNRH